MKTDIVFVDEEGTTTPRWMDKKTMHSVNLPQHACIVLSCGHGTRIALFFSSTETLEKFCLKLYVLIACM